MSIAACIAAPSLVIGLAAAAAGQVCQPAWSRWFGPAFGPASGAVTGSAAVDEDGAGPNPPVLYITGSFTQVAGIPANGAARWDGTAWTPLPGFAIPSGNTVDLTVFDPDGSGPEGDQVYRMGPGPSGYGGGPARWNGSSWVAPASNWYGFYLGFPFTALSTNRTSVCIRSKVGLPCEGYT